MAAGCRLAIARGTEPHPLAALVEGARCTWFEPPAEPLTARKRWIAGSVKPVGALVVDAGAVVALHAGKSLLPAGVVAVEGGFERGDAVLVKGPDGRRVGCGLVAFAAEDARRIAGCRSSAVESILGFGGRSEMIHRDDLVVDSIAGGTDAEADVA
jgi:glutamate 5-kinase